MASTLEGRNADRETPAEIGIGQREYPPIAILLAIPPSVLLHRVIVVLQSKSAFFAVLV